MFHTERNHGAAESETIRHDLCVLLLVQLRGLNALKGGSTSHVVMVKMKPIYASLPPRYCGRLDCLNELPLRRLAGTRLFAGFPGPNATWQHVQQMRHKAVGQGPATHVAHNLESCLFKRYPQCLPGYSGHGHCSGVLNCHLFRSRQSFQRFEYYF